MADGELAACDLLVLSPHLDDGALSCGGQIHDRARKGEKVRILTLFAGVPDLERLSAAARDLHRRWGLAADTVVDARRREDLEACDLLSAEAMHWPFEDALYRRDDETGEALYPRLGDLFGKIHPGDEAFVDEIVAKLTALPPAATILAPLGAGGHVDHQLTRLAAERVFGGRLLFYEDFPYARSWRALGRALGRRRAWTRQVWPVDEAALDVKCRAIACFASQLGTAFKNKDDMRRQVRRFARRRGGERLWRPKASATDARASA